MNNLSSSHIKTTKLNQQIESIIETRINKILIDYFFSNDKLIVEARDAFKKCALVIRTDYSSHLIKSILGKYFTKEANNKLV